MATVSHFKPFCSEDLKENDAPHDNKIISRLMIWTNLSSGQSEEQE